MQKVIIGTRGSDLAMWQARYARQQLEAAGAETEIRIIKTKGDKLQHLSFDKMEGKGFFTKELENALITGKIDLAVHSHKDLPTEYPPGLIIGATSKRALPADLLLIRKDKSDPKQTLPLKKGALTGTSSARRKAQILAYRPDVVIRDIRGNVPTRIDKLRKGDFDAIILAQAGVQRLEPDLSGLIRYDFDPVDFIPAPAQGVLAFQIREDDRAMKVLLEKVHDHEQSLLTRVEREVLRLFEGGCQMPLGVYCCKENDGFHCWAAKSASWDSLPARVHLKVDHTEGLAEKVVRQLNKPPLKTVFITRDPKPGSIFHRLLTAHGFQVKSVSLISFKKKEAGLMPRTDWIFFSSKKAVSFFADQYPDVPPHVHWAAIGEGTAAAVKEYTGEVHFTGDGADIAQTAADFLNILGEYSDPVILFPLATQSRRSIQEYLEDKVKVIDWPVYENEIREDLDPVKADIVIITSPLNASALYASGEKGKEKIIAIGSATANALREMDIIPDRIAYRPYGVNLADEVWSLI